VRSVAVAGVGTVGCFLGAAKANGDEPRLLLAWDMQCSGKNLRTMCMSALASVRTLQQSSCPAKDAARQRTVSTQVKFRPKPLLTEVKWRSPQFVSFIHICPSCESLCTNKQL